MYKMYIGIQNGEEGFIIPVLPEKIEINEDGDNKTYDVINLGEVSKINSPKLTEINFESYFPLNNGPYVSSEQVFEPSFYITKIKEWREKKQKLRFILVGGQLEINDLFTIESFKYEEHGGEIGDIYYSIELKRYKNHVARKVVIVNNNLSKANSNKVKTKSIRNTDNKKVKTYTVVNGDTLWHISKKFLGDGNRYKEIAKLNNISNPNLIYVGQVLKLP